MQDSLSNPFGGPHWLPAEYGFTPLPEIHRTSPTPSPPPHPPEDDPPAYLNPPAYLEEFLAEEQGLSQEERDFLRENGYLQLQGDESNRLPHGEQFKEYVEQKMRRFGRKPGQRDTSTSQQLPNAEEQTGPSLARPNLDGSRALPNEKTPEGPKTEQPVSTLRETIIAQGLPETEQEILQRLPDGGKEEVQHLRQRLSSLLHQLVDAVEGDRFSSADDVANAALQGVQSIIDCTRLPPREADTSQEVKDPGSCRQKADDIISPQALNKAMDMMNAEQYELFHLGLTPLWKYSEVYGSNKGQLIRHEGNSAEWEQDVSTFVHAKMPDRTFQKGEDVAKRGFEVAPPEHYNSVALGKLLHSSVNRYVESESEIRFRTRSEYVEWSDVVGRSDRPIYVLPHLRRIRILQKGRKGSLANVSMFPGDTTFGKDALVDPLLAGNPFGHDPGGANGWCGGEYGSNFAMTPGESFCPDSLSCALPFVFLFWQCQRE